MEPQGRIDVEIDRNTSVSILREFGERLQRDLPVEVSLPPRLNHLMAELRKREQDLKLMSLLYRPFYRRGAG